MAAPPQAKYTESKAVTAFRRQAIGIYTDSKLDASDKVMGICRRIREIKPDDKEAAQKKLIANIVLQRHLEDKVKKDGGSALARMERVIFFLSYIPSWEKSDVEKFKETRAMLAKEMDGAVQKFANEDAFVAKERGKMLRMLERMEWMADDNQYGEFSAACQKARRALMPLQENISEFLQQPQDRLKTKKLDEKGKLGMEYSERMENAQWALASPIWTEYDVKSEKVGKMVKKNGLELDGKQLKDLLGGKTILMSGLRIRYQDEILSSTADFAGEFVFSSAGIEEFKKDLKGENIAQALDKENTGKINAMRARERIDLDWIGRSYVVDKNEDGSLNVYRNDLQDLAKVIADNPYAAARRKGDGSLAFETSIYDAADAIKALYYDLDDSVAAKKLAIGSYGEVVRFYALAGEALRGGNEPRFSWLNKFYNYDNSKDEKLKAQVLKYLNGLMEIKGMDRSVLLKIASGAPHVFMRHQDFLKKLATGCGGRLGAVLMPGIDLDKMATDPHFKALMDEFKTDVPLLVALFQCEGVASKASREAKSEEIEKRIKVFKDFGVEYVERMDPVLLEHFYKVATGNAEEFDAKGRPRKLALIVLNKDDHNGAFTNDQDIYHSIMDHGYNLLFCEANTDIEVAERFFNYGRWAATGSANNAHFMQGKGKTGYDLLILGGHGNPSSIDFGSWKDEQANLDLKDYAKLKKYGNWESMFTDRAAIVLWSCSTGGKLEKGETSDFSNMMTMLSDITVHATFAPKTDVNRLEWEFDKDGYIVNAIYNKDKNIGNVSRPAKLQKKK